MERSFFHFVTNHTFDRQMDRQIEFSLPDSVCIPCIAVKTNQIFTAFQTLCTFDSWPVYGTTGRSIEAMSLSESSVLELINTG